MENSLGPFSSGPGSCSTFLLFSSSLAPGVFFTVCCLPSRDLSIMGLRRGRPMGQHIRKRQGQHGQIFFHPAPRHLRRQRSGAQPPCQQASQAASQRRWLSQPANRASCRGPDQVARGRQWRQDHPGSGRRKAPPVSDPPAVFQASCPLHALENQAVEGGLAQEAFQEACVVPPTVVMGLLAPRTGWSCQAASALMARRLQP